MAVNKVNFGGNTLIDLTGDTLDSAEQLLKGIIAHAKDGSVITGQMEAGVGGGSNKLYCETVTFEADTKTYEINHDLGERPNFLLYFTLSENSSFSTFITPATLLFVSNGTMYYASVGTSNSSYKGKGYATTSARTYSDKSYVNIEPITGVSLVVPSVVDENSLTLKGSSFYMPAGTYFMMCGVIEF